MIGDSSRHMIASNNIDSVHTYVEELLTIKNFNKINMQEAQIVYRKSELSSFQYVMLFSKW